MLRPRLRLAAAVVALLAVGPALAQDPAPPKDALFAPNNRGVLLWDAGGARTVATGDVVAHLACRSDGKRVYAGTDRSILVIDPAAEGRTKGTGAITSELHLAQGLPKTQALVQAIAVTGDSRHLVVAYRLRTMEKMGWIEGEPLVSAFELDTKGEPRERATWTRLVPQKRDVSSIFPGKKATDSLLLFHDMPVVVTKVDPKVEGDMSCKSYPLPAASTLKRPDRVLTLRPAQRANGKLLLPLATGGNWALAEFDPETGFYNQLHTGSGEPAQSVALSHNEKLVFLGFDRLRVLDLGSGEQKASIELLHVVHDMAVSSDGAELYMNCGQRLQVRDIAKNFNLKSEVALETVSRELAIKR